MCTYFWNRWLAKTNTNNMSAALALGERRHFSPPLFAHTAHTYYGQATSRYVMVRIAGLRSALVPLFTMATLLGSRASQAAQEQHPDNVATIASAYRHLSKHTGDMESLIDILHDLSDSLTLGAGPAVDGDDGGRDTWPWDIDMMDSRNWRGLDSLSTKLESLIDHVDEERAPRTELNEQLFLIISYINEISKSLF
ncbi:hypothetical protein GQ54DRAFT_130990 [Martensiomyces pterosporus]|nr:hypothetical protein GQ54DRAFT_130990 [Martensiomyces pterosporus]